MHLCSEHWQKNASALNDIEIKCQCLFCFFLCFRSLAITVEGLRPQNPFLGTIVRLSSEKLRLDDVYEISFNKEPSEQFFMCMVLRLTTLCLLYALG